MGQVLHKLKEIASSVGVADGAVDASRASAKASVFSLTRTVKSPADCLPENLRKKLNKRWKKNGLKLLEEIPNATIPVVFFDPQYRGILDKMGYGNEGKTRGKERSALPQMDVPTIKKFISGIDEILMPTGHLFLWMDKYELLNGFHAWLEGTSLDIVDLISWHKKRVGMGYRTRRVTEYCVVLQKKPRRAKGVWKTRDIEDTWPEKAPGGHTHSKPLDLQEALIEAVSNRGDIVVDPAAGGYSVMTAAKRCGCNFLGCDIMG